MGSKNKVEVIINGKVYTVMGTESEEYIQKVARYIDKKMSEVVGAAASRYLDQSTLFVLTSVNVADDLFKERELNSLLNEDKKDKDIVIFDLEVQVDKYQLELGKMQAENLALLDRISDLQLELTYSREQLRIKSDELSEKKKELDEYITHFDNVVEITQNKPKNNLHQKK